MSQRPPRSFRNSGEERGDGSRAGVSPRDPRALVLSGSVSAGFESWLHHLLIRRPGVSYLAPAPVSSSLNWRGCNSSWDCREDRRGELTCADAQPVTHAVGTGRGCFLSSSKGSRDTRHGHEGKTYQTPRKTAAWAEPAALGWGPGSSGSVALTQG